MAVIDFVEGHIQLDEKTVLSVADEDSLRALVDQGRIEAEEGPGGTCYSVEVMAGGKRFAVFTSPKENRTAYLVLSWLDGPCTSKGWEDVSDQALNDEYRQLSRFVEKRAGRPPDATSDRQRTWRFKWGQVDVSYLPRDFVAHICMTPRCMTPR